MNITNKKCFIENHENAVIFCNECKKLLCNKCQHIHSTKNKDHHIISLEEDVFIDLCFEDDHYNNLEYYCKTHNKLCCKSCIQKNDNNKKGKHFDCDFCSIENIKEEMKEKLKNNLSYLKLIEEDSEQLEEIKKKYEEILLEKDKMKIKIQKVFTKLRNALNNREDELLLKINKKC